MATQRLTPEKKELRVTITHFISQEERERINRDLAELDTAAGEMDGICPECYANVSCDCL